MMQPRFSGLLLASLFCVSAGLAIGQVQTAEIRGRVANNSGEGIAGVRLSLRVEDLSVIIPAVVATRNSSLDGSFVFDEIKPGRYLLEAERSGFVRQYYGGAWTETATVLSVSAGESLTVRLGMTLVAEPGLITGRVVDNY